MKPVAAANRGLVARMARLTASHTGSSVLASRSFRQLSSAAPEAAAAASASGDTPPPAVTGGSKLSDAQIRDEIRSQESRGANLDALNAASALPRLVPRGDDLTPQELEAERAWRKRDAEALQAAEEENAAFRRWYDDRVAQIGAVREGVVEDTRSALERRRDDLLRTPRARGDELAAVTAEIRLRTFQEQRAKELGRELTAEELAELPPAPTKQELAGERLRVLLAKDRHDVQKIRVAWRQAMGRQAPPRREDPAERPLALKARSLGAGSWPVADGGVTTPARHWRTNVRRDLDAVAATEAVAESAGLTSTDLTTVERRQLGEAAPAARVEAVLRAGGYEGDLRGTDGDAAAAVWKPLLDRLVAGKPALPNNKWTERRAFDDAADVPRDPESAEPLLQRLARGASAEERRSHPAVMEALAAAGHAAGTLPVTPGAHPLSQLLQPSVLEQADAARAGLADRFEAEPGLLEELFAGVSEASVGADGSVELGSELSEEQCGLVLSRIAEKGLLGGLLPNGSQDIADLPLLSEQELADNEDASMWLANHRMASALELDAMGSLAEQRSAHRRTGAAAQLALYGEGASAEVAEAAADEAAAAEVAAEASAASSTSEAEVMTAAQRKAQVAVEGAASRLRAATLGLPGSATHAAAAAAAAGTGSAQQLVRAAATDAQQAESAAEELEQAVQAAEAAGVPSEAVSAARVAGEQAVHAASATLATQAERDAVLSAVLGRLGGSPAGLLASLNAADEAGGEVVGELLAALEAAGASAVASPATADAAALVAAAAEGLPGAASASSAGDSSMSLSRPKQPAGGAAQVAVAAPAQLAALRASAERLVAHEASEGASALASDLRDLIDERGSFALGARGDPALRRTAAALAESIASGGRTLGADAEAAIATKGVGPATPFGGLTESQSAELRSLQVSIKEEEIAPVVRGAASRAVARLLELADGVTAAGAPESKLEQFPVLRSMEARRGLQRFAATPALQEAATQALAASPQLVAEAYRLVDAEKTLAASLTPEQAAEVDALRSQGAPASNAAGFLDAANGPARPKQPAAPGSAAQASAQVEAAASAAVTEGATGLLGSTAADRARDLQASLPSLSSYAVDDADRAAAKSVYSPSSLSAVAALTYRHLLLAEAATARAAPLALLSEAEALALSGSTGLPAGDGGGLRSSAPADPTDDPIFAEEKLDIVADHPAAATAGRTGALARLGQEPFEAMLAHARRRAWRRQHAASEAQSRVGRFLERARAALGFEVQADDIDVPDRSNQVPELQRRGGASGGATSTLETADAAGEGAVEMEGTEPADTWLSRPLRLLQGLTGPQPTDAAMGATGMQGLHAQEDGLGGAGDAHPAEVLGRVPGLGDEDEAPALEAGAGSSAELAEAQKELAAATTAATQAAAQLQDAMGEEEGADQLTTEYEELQEIGLMEPGTDFERLRQLSVITMDQASRDALLTKAVAMGDLSWVDAERLQAVAASEAAAKRSRPRQDSQAFDVLPGDADPTAPAEGAAFWLDDVVAAVGYDPTDPFGYRGLRRLNAAGRVTGTPDHVLGEPGMSTTGQALLSVSGDWRRELELRLGGSTAGKRLAATWRRHEDDGVAEEMMVKAMDRTMHRSDEIETVEADEHAEMMLARQGTLTAMQGVTALNPEADPEVQEYYDGREVAQAELAARARDHMLGLVHPLEAAGVRPAWLGLHELAGMQEESMRLRSPLPLKAQPESTFSQAAYSPYHFRLLQAARWGEMEAALMLFEHDRDARRPACSADWLGWNIMLDAAARNGDAGAARAVIDDMVACGGTISGSLLSSLIRLESVRRDVVRAEAMLKVKAAHATQMPLTHADYEAVISANLAAGRFHRAVQLVNSMKQQHQVRPSVFRLLFSHCVEHDLRAEMHQVWEALLLSTGTKLDHSDLVGLIRGFAAQENVDDMWSAFEVLRDSQSRLPDAETLVLLFNELVEGSRFGEARQLSALFDEAGLYAQGLLDQAEVEEIVASFNPREEMHAKLRRLHLHVRGHRQYGVPFSAEARADRAVADAASSRAVEHMSGHEPGKGAYWEFVEGHDAPDAMDKLRDR